MREPFDLELSEAAVGDIEDLLNRSEDKFGVDARRRYDVLVAAALRDITTDPFRPASRARSEIGAEIRTYHLRFSRARAKSAAGVVGAPRHLFVYETAPPRLVRVLRVLHDAMDIVQHVLRTAREDQA